VGRSTTVAEMLEGAVHVVARALETAAWAALLAQRSAGQGPDARQGRTTMKEAKNWYAVRAVEGARVISERKFRDRIAALRFADLELLGGREVTLLLGPSLATPPRLLTAGTAPAHQR
jgi:hypothetical protein